MTQPLNWEACADALSEPDTFGTVLVAIVARQYGLASLLGDASSGEEPWDLIQLFNQLCRDFDLNLPVELENRLQACQMVLLYEGAFHQDPQVFRACCKALASGQVPDPISGAFSDLNPYEILWGLYETNLLLDGQAPPMSKAVTELITREFSASAEELDEMVESPRDGTILEMAEVLKNQLRRIGVEMEQ